MAAKRGPKSPMTPSHKAALADGRAQGNAVRKYLEALKANKPRRGRKRTAESVNKRLAAISDELETADAIAELRLVQERRDLEAELATMDAGTDLAEVEQSFIDVAAAYSERHGISYASWRDVGVSAAVLRSAGITRSS